MNYPKFHGIGIEEFGLLNINQTISWPESVSITSLSDVTSWKIFDPKMQDESGLVVGSGKIISFTPTFHSGIWTVIALDYYGKIIHYERILLGDEYGWMIAPDWEDAGWSLLHPNSIITARSGKTVTIKDCSYTTPETMDIIYRTVPIPLGLQVETELYRNIISGNNDTSMLMIGISPNAASYAYIAAGCGLEQITAGTQRAIRFKDNLLAHIGAAGATPRRVRCDWALDKAARSPAIIEHVLTDAETFYDVSIINYGGIGLAPNRHFGLWVGRRTSDGNPYTVSVQGRLRIS